METLIKQKLDEIEKQFNVTIFYACESGSRAWGFESTDSDYDIRFLYYHPVEWYLSVYTPGRDVIDTNDFPIEGDLDFAGWDIRKALTLLRKSNPPLLEWLESPIVYKCHPIVWKIKEAAALYYSNYSAVYHYLQMASNNQKKYLDSKIVNYKKYFYVLRPILSCHWIMQDKGQVPMKFDTLVNEIVTDPELKFAISVLIVKKREGLEIGEGEQIPVISKFIKESFKELGQHPSPTVSKDFVETGFDKMDELFRSIVLP